MSCLPVSDSSFDVAAAAILQFCCMTLKLEALSNESRQTKRDDAFFRNRSSCTTKLRIFEADASCYCTEENEVVCLSFVEKPCQKNAWSFFAC